MLYCYTPNNRALRSPFFLTLFAFTVLAFFSVRAFAQTLPANFSQVLVANGISNPTTMQFAPDGRLFVAEQTGALRIIKNGTLLSQPFVTLSVNASGERGLLGIAFDPAFNTNHYIYLYYTASSAANNRISRFTANGDVAVAGSEVVILNLDPLSSATNHNGGTMQFGKDGKLYIGVGENANPSNAQNLDTYHGKILRINPDGSVPSGNPFASGSAQRQRVWAYGMRNPFTLTVEPGTGRIFVNDVGQNTWEEVNDCTTGGGNYGWPNAEGISNNSSYVNPIYTYQHGSGSGLGCAITGGTFFNPASTNYPAQYSGNYFFLDYCGNWIDKLTLNGSMAMRSQFASSIAGSPVCMATGPDGNLYFLSRSNAAVYKIVYTASNAPLITNQPQSQTASVSNAATFSVTATGSAPIGYQWRKNGTAISGATRSSYTIASVRASDAGTYSVVVSNASGSVTSNDATLTVTAPNTAPKGSITTPATGATYGGGQVISYSGTATDAEDGSLPASAFEWYVIFHHDMHTHPGPDAPDGVKSSSVTIPNSSETSAEVYYRLCLVVTDSKGAKDTTYRDILPRTSTITLNTNPQGLRVTLDGQPFTAPLTVTSVEGVLRTISVPSPQLRNNALKYAFDSWSQGGAKTQTIATPVSASSYTATFAPQLRAADAPTNTVTGLDYNYYQGFWSRLPDFTTLAPAKNGSTSNITLAPRTRNDSFAFRFTGFIAVPADGVYTFYITSDDGSRLLVGTDVVVKNDGAHSAREASGQIGLKAGKHAVAIEYFERTGRETLIVQYGGAGIAKQPVPDAAWFHTTASAVTSVGRAAPLETENRAAVMLFPNPATNQLTVTIQHFTGRATLKIVDMTGRLLREQLLTTAQTQLSIPELRAGFYTVLIEDKRGRSATKVRVDK